MKSRFDFDSVSRVTGVFVLVTGLVLLTVLLAAARVQRWFEPVYRLEVDLGEEGASGLEPGADVEMLGTTLGRVESITLDENEQRELSAIAILALRGERVKYVREDSEVILQGGGFLGTAYVEITRGTGEGLFPEGVREAVIERGVSPAEDMLADAKKIAEDLLGQVDDLIDKVEEILLRAEQEGALGLLVGFEERQRLLEDFRASGALGLALGLESEGYAEVTASLSTVHDLLASLESDGIVKVLLADQETADSLARALRGIETQMKSLDANGPLGWLLGRSQAGDSITAMLADLRVQTDVLARRGPVEVLLADPEQDPQRAQRIAADLEAILANIKLASDTLPPLAESLEEEATSLPGVVAESQETLRQIEILVRAIQQHWLIRGYVDPRPGQGRIPVDELGIGEGR